MSRLLTTRARAKINLSLHVLGRRADGYHELESLVAFAAVGDELTLEPGGAFSLTVTGEGAGAIGTGADNLVSKAVAALARRCGGIVSGRFHLEKNLPVASGIGGGSSDAAAAIRLLAKVNGMALDSPLLHEIAAEIGADVPVCLAQSTRMMRGIGADL
ncbi:MAG TPA: 4-(cytidine 5'-diphospho)-2-C-methyl-D-erythritol kinase, partial [Saliniramus sp.]|nr:4-(cytidine 5'-diphospho)-2-C-methyl-D-erythritol kinase [Saliniramus sp.]